MKETSRNLSRRAHPSDSCKLQTTMIASLLSLCILVSSSMFLQPSRSLGRDLPSSGARHSAAGNNLVAPGSGDLAESIYRRHAEKRRQYPKPGTVRGTPYYAQVLEYYAPHYQCIGEERVGAWGDGGKWVCRPEELTRDSVVYSVGSNGQTDFEEDVAGRAGGGRPQIHVWDMTVKDPKALAHLAGLKDILTFHPVGLANTTTPRLQTLEGMMASLGHSYIDILKVDCEDCEYRTFPAIFELARRKGRILFGQVQLEVHYVQSKAARLHNLLQMFEDNGYRLFHLEHNEMWSEGIELAYIHESLCQKALRP